MKLSTVCSTYECELTKIFFCSFKFNINSITQHVFFLQTILRKSVNNFHFGKFFKLKTIKNILVVYVYNKCWQWLPCISMHLVVMKTILPKELTSYSYVIDRI